MNIKNPCTQCIVRPMCNESCKLFLYYDERNYIIFKFIMAIVLGILGAFLLLVLARFEKQLGGWLLLVLIPPNWLLTASLMLFVQGIKQTFKLRKMSNY